MSSEVCRRPHRSQRGQTLIEFAVIFPLVMFIFMGLLDFGLALDQRLQLQQAVREGSRNAAVTEDQTTIKQTTANAASSAITTANVQICYPPNPSDGGVGRVGDPVKVYISPPFVWTLPLVGGFLPSIGTITMSPSGTARLELAVTGAASWPCPGP